MDKNGCSFNACGLKILQYACISTYNVGVNEKVGFTLIEFHDAVSRAYPLCTPGEYCPSKNMPFCFFSLMCIVLFVSDIVKQHQACGEGVRVQVPAPLAGNWVANIIR
jgi:hypothetical protein